MFDRKRREPVEKTFAPCQLSDQHHAGQEQIDVDALAHAIERIANRQ